jgi:hypothetical protein
MKILKRQIKQSKPITIILLNLTNILNDTKPIHRTENRVLLVAISPFSIALPKSGHEAQNF